MPIAAAADTEPQPEENGDFWQYRQDAKRQGGHDPLWCMTCQQAMVLLGEIPATTRPKRPVSVPWSQKGGCGIGSGSWPQIAVRRDEKDKKRPKSNPFVFLSARPSDERCLLWGSRSHIHRNSPKDTNGVSDGGYFEVKRPAVSAKKYPEAQKNKKKPRETAIKMWGK